MESGRWVVRYIAVRNTADHLVGSGTNLPLRVETKRSQGQCSQQYVVV